jgi:hypothetical protein
VQPSYTDGRGYIVSALGDIGGGQEFARQLSTALAIQSIKKARVARMAPPMTRPTSSARPRERRSASKTTRSSRGGDSGDPDPGERLRLRRHPVLGLVNYQLAGLLESLAKGWS